MRSPDGWTGGQASVLRWLLGVALAVRVAFVASGTPDLGALEIGVGSLAFLASATLAIGASTRASAALLAVCLFAFTAPPQGWPLALVLPFRSPWDRVSLEVLALVWVACWPAAPYGSLAAAGRADPDGGWRLGPRFRGLWFAWCAFMAYGAANVWRMQRRSDELYEQYEGRISVEGGLTSFLEPIELAVAVLALAVALLGWFRRGRPAAWVASVGVLGFLWCFQLAPWAFWSYAWFLLALFDPAWIRAKPGAVEVFYDGECALCQGSVRFAVAEDRVRQVSFGPLAGETFARLANERTAAFPDSIVVRAGSEPLVRSAAVLRLAAGLGGLWRVVAVLGSLVPRPLRDVVYDAVARVRKRLGVRAAGVCPVAGDEVTARFLP